MDQRPTAFLAGYGRGTDALSAGLVRSAFQIRAFDSFESVLTDVLTESPELILFGESPDFAHVGFARDLRDLGYEGLLLFLSDSADPLRASQVLEAGADDVIGPPHSVGAILLRRVVHLRRRAAGQWSTTKPHQLRLGDVTVDPSTHEVMGGPDRSFTLSGRELEVLVRLMEARGDVVSRENLLNEIWGAEHRSEAVLDTTVHRLRRRLGEEISRADLVATVRGVGYRLRTGMT